MFLNNLDATYEWACISTSKYNYYTYIFITPTGYNDYNNMPLSNTNIREEIRNGMEKKSIKDANNVTADTFNHASSAKR